MRARESLRAQIARLERELSAIVADASPIQPAPGADAGVRWPVPCLPGLGRARALARPARWRGCSELRRRGAARAERQRRARELLERMQLEPGRYKFARLPVTELGEPGCGVWEVRPRLGLIGMLAGWWQLKLSSGCPLPRGSRSRRGPVCRGG